MFFSLVRSYALVAAKPRWGFLILSLFVLFVFSADSLRLDHHPEADVVVAEGDAVVVAVGAAGEAGGLVPGAAAEDTLFSGGWTRGIDDGNRRKRRTNTRGNPQITQIIRRRRFR